MARLLPLIWLTAALRLLAADAFDPIRVSIRKQLVETQVPSLALAVARDGRIVWEEGFGWADREKRVAATEHTLYSLASISKPITATGLMVLVEAGKIDLDKTTVKTGERGGYGIGWSSTERPDGYRVVAHAGGMGGVSTSLRLVESEKLAVVVLANGSHELPHRVSEEIFAAMLPRWKRAPSEPPKPPREFRPGPELLGEWKGALSTYKAELPLAIQILPSGDVHVRIGDQLKTLLNRVSFEDGRLSGATTGDIGTEDANRRPYFLQFDLALREGGVLNGAATAISRPGPRAGNALTSWVELKKR